MSKTFKEILADTKLYFETFLRIKTKGSSIVPFKLNPAQQKVYEVYVELRALGKPIRIIVLKARQEGISTFFEAVLFFLTTTMFNIKATIVGHESKASSNLFEMCKRFYDYLPDPMKPSVKYNSEKKLTFDKLKSEIIVETAEGRGGLGRSGTINLLHLTEVAFWVDAKASMNAVLQSVPDESNTMVVIESTANGVGGVFHDYWKDAVKGKSDYIPIFLAWFDLPEYSLEFDSREMKDHFEESLTQEEKELAELYHLSLEQLNWRRRTIANKCGGSISIFQQEYPSNPLEAFITSGRPVFDMDICRRNHEKYEDYKPQKFNLEYVYGDKKKTNGKLEIVGVKRVNNEFGYWTMLEEFQIDSLEDYRFAVGCDVAEGLEQGDYSSMDVLDRKNMKYVIKFHGHIEPDLLAVEQHKLQMFLDNKVYFCTEVNNHGLTVVVHAYKLRVKQYYRQNYQKGYEVDSMQLGFKTTGSVSGTGTKPMLIDRLIEAIREEGFIDEDSEFWEECMTFVKNAKGQMQAQGKDKDPSTKNFDDRVISKALSLECNSWMPNYYIKKPKPYNYNERKVKDVTDF
jgi:hypothetical protein